MKYRLRITDEESKKEINVSEDEIIEVKYKIGLAEDTNLANSRSTVEMEITGKIISNLEMFVDLGSNKKMDLKFTNMFVYNFLQEMSIEKGIGIFKLKLRQKFHQKNKLDIK